MSATESSIMCVVNLVVTEESGLSRVYVQKVGKSGWDVSYPVDTALKPVRACATVVSSRYSAWRVPAILWFPAYAGMTVGFAKVSIKGEGDMVGLDLLRPHHPAALWIDESPITLCQRVRLQRKGVNALSFSSRKRPACAGMTVRDAANEGPAQPCPVVSRLRGNDGKGRGE